MRSEQTEIKIPTAEEPLTGMKQNGTQDLRDLYKKLISVRNNYKALRTGSFETILKNNEKNYLCFRRYDEKINSW
jgi:glycosidase